MNIREVSEKFNISMTALRYYERVKLFDDVKRINGIREYTDKDIERLSLILTLKNAGLNLNSILKYIEFLKQDENSINERIKILRKQRHKLLDEIHVKQRDLDSLDYLIYKLLNTDNK